MQKSSSINFRELLKKMKVLTWNINGIRSVRKDQSLKKLFDSLDADIICLQETKITREMLKEETAIVEGYNAYFSFSKVRSGYSGVATFCRNNVTPVKAEDRIHLPVSDSDNIIEENLFTNEELESLNAEGRTLLTEHLDTEGNHVVIINLYCPRADLDNEERTRFKLKFYSLVEKKCKSLRQENKHVIVLGDFNFSHKPIDHCDPNDPEIFDSNPSRQWANTFIWDPSNDEPTTANPSCPAETRSTTVTGENETYEARQTSNEPQPTKFIDSFRYFHPDQKSAFTCWSTLTGARQTNYGTRIDYIFSSAEFFKTEFTACVIRPDIEGSDHCPVVATLRSTFRSAAKPPPLCTKYMPEFSGKQQKLKDFFKKSESNTSVCNLNESANKMKANAVLVVNENKSKIKEISADKTRQKGSEKRPAQSTIKSQAKRLKTNTGASQGKIFQFFEKKSTKFKTDSNKQTDSNAKMVADRLANTNESDSGISEERPEPVPHVDKDNDNVELCSSLDSANSLSQTSTSSCSVSDSSTKSSSQNATESIEETQQRDSQYYSQEQHNSDKKSAAVVSSWKSILKGLPPAPLCSGHKEPCVLRTVKNKGLNHGRQFYCCARPQGHSTNKEARCNHFTWRKK